MSNLGGTPKVMRIEDAPPRVRREHHRRERRNTLIAMVTIALAVALLAAVVTHLVC